MSRWLAQLLCLLLLPCATAHAQSSETCVLLLSHAAQPRVAQAVRVELQLSGCRVLEQRVSSPVSTSEARELAAHAQAEVFEVAPHAVRRVGPGGRELREPVEESHPRALAAVAGWLRSRPFGVPEAAPQLGVLTPSPARRTLPSEAPRVHPFLLTPPSSPTSPSSPRSPRASERRPVPGQLTRPAPAERAPLPAEERVAWELLGGVTAGVALGAAAAGIAGALTPADDPFQWWAVGLVAGGTVGVGLGVLLAGRLTGANGDAAWTLLASLLGGALAGGMLALGYAVDRSPTDGIDTGFNFLGAALAVVAPPALSILAFELTLPQ